MTKTGIVESIKFTSGGAGNQWTTIDGVRYATYWDIRRTNWKRGDRVTFNVYDAPLWSGMSPIPHADNIMKVKE